MSDSQPDPNQYVNAWASSRPWHHPQPGEEPEAFDLLIGYRSDLPGRTVSLEDGRRKQTTLYNQRMRIRARFRHYVHEHGKYCVECSSHFTPKRVDQLRCPECLAAIRKPTRPRKNA